MQNDKKEDCKAVVFGCNGLNITDEEKVFFAKNQPLGFILFGRNIESPEQVKRLVKDLKATVKYKNPLILIDQEGGKVARLKPPHWKKTLPAKLFAELAEKNLEFAVRATYLNHRIMAKELLDLGINVNCAPVLDLLIEESDEIIGSRAFGHNPEQVSLLAEAACKGLLDEGVFPILKHIPGHGRADADSHKALPIITESLDLLEKTDFAPFKALSHFPMAMTAHIKYTAIDSEFCATFSPKVIDLIRNQIGFKGLLFTDDLSMEALDGSFVERTEKALNAGCDIILHCNGKIEEMEEIAASVTLFPEYAKVRLLQCNMKRQ